MSELRIYMFGGFRLEHRGLDCELHITRTIQALLAYLALHRHRTHTRDVLCDLFWGEYPEERARGSLSTALWRLRAVLEPEGVPRSTYLLTTANGQVGFNVDSPHWLDVAEFELGIGPVVSRGSGALETEDVSTLEKALLLYSGELLDGFYDDWAIRERERLRLLRLDCLAHLMACSEQHGAYEASLAYGQQILELDPLREEIHRVMMRLFLRCGQRIQAVRQYETCREVLEAELGIPPMEETSTLYQQIVTGEAQPSRPATSESTRVCPALHQLRQALLGAGAAHVKLQRAVDLVERALREEDLAGT